MTSSSSSAETDANTDSALDSWTDDQRARIEKFAESKDIADLTDDPPNAGVARHHVSPDTCKAWRDTLRANSGRSAGSLSGGFASTTKRKHAYGNCQHDAEQVGEPAAAREDWERRGGI